MKMSRMGVTNIAAIFTPRSSISTEVTAEVDVHTWTSEMVAIMSGKRDKAKHRTKMSQFPDRFRIRLLKNSYWYICIILSKLKKDTDLGHSVRYCQEYIPEHIGMWRIGEYFRRRFPIQRDSDCVELTGFFNKHIRLFAGQPTACKPHVLSPSSRNLHYRMVR